MDPTDDQFHVRLGDGRQFGPASIALLKQWAGERRIPPDAHIIPASGGDPIPARDHPDLAPLFGAGGTGLRPVHAPPTVPGAIPAPKPDGISTLIPYRNPAALAGYYVAVLSLVPLIALLAGPVAIVLGVFGLKHARAHAHARGRAHAWVAISLGTLTLLANVVILFFMFMAR